MVLPATTYAGFTRAAAYETVLCVVDPDARDEVQALVSEGLVIRLAGIGDGVEFRDLVIHGDQV